MKNKPQETEKDIIRGLISFFTKTEVIPSRLEIEEKAKIFALAHEYEGDLQSIVTDAEIIIPSRMKAGVSLVDTEAVHDKDWVRGRTIDTTYADAYAEHLKSQNWHPAVVNTLLNEDGTKILGLLQDPTCNGSWSRRGLVIGHVQSGKTANYMGVIAKAADAGYKFFIVIAGIHNNLRKQTQERIDEGFVGRSSDPLNKIKIGVGLDDNYPNPVTLTNVTDDFNKNTATQMGWKLNDFSKPIILVIKKNVNTLKALHKWLKDMNAKGDGRISDVPMLMIDDEADNASINTNKPDVDPTKTNSWIRKILRLFTKNCYVGYTATPFANIFIDPDAFDEDAYEELFPKDFIYSLNAPPTYFGPDKVFLDETTSDAILRRIDDCEEYLPISHKNGRTVTELPPSLYQALDNFIIARTIRNLGGQNRKHCSMLVNVSRFVSVQREVKSYISLQVDELGKAVKANYMMPEEISAKNFYMVGLKRAFEFEFSESGFQWKDVKNALWGAFENLRIYVVNSKSDETLDYKKYEEDGEGLTAIAIGGLSLSRGLTIEGLTISYMYRNTRMYDTLMQMGRWFGYRYGYEDLCRVYLPQDSINWYSHIAEASEELRQQINEMGKAGLSPKDFGLYVLSHPDSPSIKAANRLRVTAANKMRGGEEVTLNQNFTGKLIESTLLPLDKNINAENETLIQKYWRDRFGCSIEATEKGWFIPDVKTEKIEKFLSQFESHKDAVIPKTLAINYLGEIGELFPFGDVLLISKGAGDPKKYRLGAQDRTAKDATSEGWRLSKHRLASRGDEKLGLTDLQLKAAEALAAEDEKSKSKKPSDFHYRVVRNKPLLMLHILQPVDNPEFANRRIPGWGLSFPNGLFNTQIKVVANRIWIEKMLTPLDDDPDGDEDYDDD